MASDDRHKFEARLRQILDGIPEGGIDIPAAIDGAIKMIAASSEVEDAAERLREAITGSGPGTLSFLMAAAVTAVSARNDVQVIRPVGIESTAAVGTPTIRLEAPAPSVAPATGPGNNKIDHALWYVIAVLVGATAGANLGQAADDVLRDQLLLALTVVLAWVALPKDSK